MADIRSVGFILPHGGFLSQSPRAALKTAGLPRDKCNRFKYLFLFI